MELQFIPIQRDKKHANRHLLVLDVSEVARALGATVAVSYLNVMDPGAIAGNHRHARKLEAMRAVVGRLQVDLLDVDTGERETVILDDSGDDTYGLCLIIPPGVGHAVTNLGTTVGVLEVFATEPPRVSDDDFPCMVTPAS